MKKILSFAFIASVAMFPLLSTAAGHRTVNLEAPGTLEETLGDEVLSLDSLTISGPLNDTDFQTMWNGSFNGQLSYINLKEALPEGDAIPEKAFYHSQEQNNGAYVMTLSLRELILPKNLVRIDNFALMHVNLNSLTLPESLKEIGICAFSYSRTNWGDLVIPGNVEHIGVCAFLSNYNIDSITFPSSLVSIGDQAFYGPQPKTITFSEGLESIGAFAFGGSYVEELILPNSLKTIGECAFQQMHWLKRLKLPSSLESIPFSCFNGCALEELTIPGNIKRIEMYAFQNCYNLTKLTFEHGAEGLAIDSFSGLSKLKEVYSEDPMPPLCDYNTEINGDTGVGPFGNPLGGYPSEAILYVPEGSVDSYRNSLGWNYFKDIRPYDFPYSGITAAETAAEPIKVNVVDGGIMIESPIGGEYMVYGIDGKLISKGEVDKNASLQIPLPEGCYLVSVNRDSHKIYIK